MGRGRPRIGEEPCECCGVRRKDFSPDTPATEARFCKECREFLRNEGRLRAKEARETPSDKVPVTAPDGSILNLGSNDEKVFYENRLIQYVANFDFNESSDAGLLSLLLTLEIQSKRVEADLIECRHKPMERSDLAKALVKLTEEISKVQGLLGVARGKRKQEQALNVAEYFQDLFKRFLVFKSEKRPAWNAGVVFNKKEKIWEDVPDANPAN